MANKDEIDIGRIWRGGKEKNRKGISKSEKYNDGCTLSTNGVNPSCDPPVLGEIILARRDTALQTVPLSYGGFIKANLRIIKLNYLKTTLTQVAVSTFCSNLTARFAARKPRKAILCKRRDTDG
jgi:hypothetical protein